MNGQSYRRILCTQPLNIRGHICALTGRAPPRQPITATICLQVSIGANWTMRWNISNIVTMSSVGSRPAKLSTSNNSFSSRRVVVLADILLSYLPALYNSLPYWPVWNIFWPMTSLCVFVRVYWTDLQPSTSASPFTYHKPPFLKECVTLSKIHLPQPLLLSSPQIAPNT